MGVQECQFHSLVVVFFATTARFKLKMITPHWVYKYDCCAMLIVRRLVFDCQLTQRALVLYCQLSGHFGIWKFQELSVENGCLSIYRVSGVTFKCYNLVSIIWRVQLTLTFIRQVSGSATFPNIAYIHVAHVVPKMVLLHRALHHVWMQTNSPEQVCHEKLIKKISLIINIHDEYTLRI
jgi:hypothetical protein